MHGLAMYDFVEHQFLSRGHSLGIYASFGKLLSVDLLFAQNQ